MTELIQKNLRASKAARWSVLAIVSFTIMWGYFLADALSPLMSLLELKMGWSSAEFGLFNSVYCWFNVFLFMIVIGGFVLDKIGVRLTGLLSCALMIVGAFIKYWAIEFVSPEVTSGGLFGLRPQVWLACLGYATFSMGMEICGITVSKVIVRWFQGRELALAMGLQVAVSRLGMALSMMISPLLAEYYSLSAPLGLSLSLLCVGLLAYLVFCVMDRALEHRSPSEVKDKDDAFRLSEIKLIISQRAFWLITLFCLTFYSSVLPFLKYAASFMENNYDLPPQWAGLIPSLLPLGNIILTPLFGVVYDKKGKGATMMALGVVLLLLVYLILTLPVLKYWYLAALPMLGLAVAFSMVPAALWPSVARIIPEKALGTAYALVFWVQNIGLGLMPLFIGWVLDKYCKNGVRLVEGGFVPHYDYTLIIYIFMLLSLVALGLALALKAEDRRRGYGLE